MSKQSTILSLTTTHVVRTITPQGVSKEIEENIRDISISANGTMWAVTIDPLATEKEAGGGGVVKYKEPKGKKWITMESGGATKIDGGPSGSKAYIINNKGEVWQLEIKKEPKQLAGAGFAREISAGADGTVWVISNEPVHGGGLIQYLENDHWIKVPGEIGGNKITGTPDGKALIVNVNGMIAKVTKEGGFEQMTGDGFAKEVSVAPDSSIWIISNEPSQDGGNKVSYQPAEGGAWQDIEGGAVILDAGFA